MDDLFEVSLLWYKGAEGLPVHWAIFVSVPDAPEWDYYDVKTADTPFTPRWEREYRDSYDVRKSNSLGGRVFLGYTSDPAEMEDVIKRQALPNILTENCQSWVWRVIRKAVEKEILDSSAIDNLEEAPANG
jgi:hypothetical protein